MCAVDWRAVLALTHRVAGAQDDELLAAGIRAQQEALVGAGSACLQRVVQLCARAHFDTDGNRVAADDDEEEEEEDGADAADEQALTTAQRRLLLVELCKLRREL